MADTNFGQFTLEASPVLTDYVVGYRTAIAGGERRTTLTSLQSAILANYAGGSSIVTVGTIGTGVWQGTAVADSYIASASTWNAKQSAITFGTGVQTALGVNVGSAGAVLINGGALGTPSSGTLASCTGLPVSSGISGLGTGAATALAINVGTTGAFLTDANASTTITGTANQVIASASVGPVTLSLPQSIGTTSTPQFSRLGIGQPSTTLIGAYLLNLQNPTGNNQILVGFDSLVSQINLGAFTGLSAIGVRGRAVGSGSGAVDNAYAFYAVASAGAASNKYSYYGESGAGRLNVIDGITTTGTIIAGSGPTTLTDSAGKILSAALNTVAVANGGTGLTALGTGVTTALAINVGSAGAFVTFNGALGTPSSGTLTNCTGLPVAGGGTGASTLTANNVILGNGTSAVQFVAPGTSGNVLTSNGTTWASSAPTVGNLVYPLNSGAQTFLDMPVTSAATIGTEQSYAFKIDTNTVFKIYAESDGAGGIQNAAIQVNGAQLNLVVETVAAGTAYTMTTSYATLDFGTTDPTITLTAAGTYIIFAEVQTALVSATTTTQTESFKLRRTNNTAADVSSIFSSPLPVATVGTQVGPSVAITATKYTTVNANDIIALQGILSGALGAGSVTATDARVIAVRLY